ncbi:hypothetical protein KEG38_05295 [Polyangium jinanense]|uniref:hypothetical protein n=1 Tax=Polyangium jinanense TaxID=2829994 RepID=UPI0023425BC9|nr:hypothetical protein [Polyangium jinanense]MDC3953245.1 hypothetical protein [Polyangium jinanense]
MSTNNSPAKLSRAQKATIGRKLHDNLILRAQKGPPEPMLDAFIPQLDAITIRLETHVTGKDETSAARAAHADRSEKADIEVDTLARHIEGYIDIEASRRAGPHVASARALHTAAFPRGRAFLDDYIPDQNQEIRRILSVLRAPEHAPTLAGISFPMVWLDRLESAVEESDFALAEKATARGAIGDHISLGKGAEAAWVDVVGRLRKYLESRAPAGNVEIALENGALLAPLNDAIAHAKAVAAARATRRKKKPAAPAAAAPAAEPTA